MRLHNRRVDGADATSRQLQDAPKMSRPQIRRAKGCMKLRKDNLDICANSLLKLGKPLEQLSGPRLPSKKDVVRHFYFHLWSKPTNQRSMKLAAWKTAESLLRCWRPTYIPTFTKPTVRSMIVKLVDKDLRKYR